MRETKPFPSFLSCKKGSAWSILFQGISILGFLLLLCQVIFVRFKKNSSIFLITHPCSGKLHRTLIRRDHMCTQSSEYKQESDLFWMLFSLEQWPYLSLLTQMSPLLTHRSLRLLFYSFRFYHSWWWPTGRVIGGAVRMHKRLLSNINPNPVSFGIFALFPNSMYRWEIYSTYF